MLGGSLKLPSGFLPERFTLLNVRDNKDTDYKRSTQELSPCKLLNFSSVLGEIAAL